MKGIHLTMKEQEKNRLIKNLVKNNGNKKTVALKLGCSLRHINRLIKGYKEKGKSYFSHGNKGKTPQCKIDETLKEKVVNLYKKKYKDTNFTHFKELLEDNENIVISRSSISFILREKNIISPKAHRKTKRELKKELSKKIEKTESIKEKRNLQTGMLDFIDAHPRKERKAYAGELIQMDASVHNWFGYSKTFLHAAIDDTTGTVVGASFDEQETLNGYYQVYAQILRDYGIPYEFLTDKRTIFEYKRKGKNNLEKDTFTQFSYACNQLGTKLSTTSIAQVKGRIERLFNTLQSRLPAELRLAGVTTIDAANEFLKSYLNKFNAQFAIDINNTKSVFVTQVEEQTINRTLAVLDYRKIDTGCTFSHKNNSYFPIDKCGKRGLFKKGKKVLVIKTLDGNLCCCINDKMYALELLPIHEVKSDNFDFDEQVKIRKPYIPKMEHPWRQYKVKKHFNIE